VTISRRIRAVAVQSPAIAIAAVALLFSVGGGAGYAASALNSGQTTIVFHPLHLINHWMTGGSPGVRAPSFALSGGVVYLTGGMDQNEGSSTKFAVLPRGDRPSHTLWFSAFTANGLPGSVEIKPDGDMFIGGQNGPAFASRPRTSTTAAGVT
jgi:hypothetical protein